MRRIARIGVVGAALLWGCAPLQWVRPDASVEQAKADEEDCYHSAWREAQSRAGYYPAAGPVFSPGSSGGGPMIWPSGSMVDPYGYQMLEQQRLAQFCMEAKGYKLAPAATK